MLRDVYLAETVREASEKQRRHPTASFVTSDGVLVGPAVIHTAREADARAREIRAELQVVVHDLSATVNALNPRKERLDGDRGRDRVPARADRGRRRGDHRDRGAAGPAGARPHRAAQGAGAARAAPGRAGRGRRRGDANGWRPSARSSRATSRSFRPRRSSPIQHRVAVETLRRDRVTHDERRARLRAERDALAAHDPAQLRAELEAAEARARRGRGRGRAQPRRPPRPRSPRASPPRRQSATPPRSEAAVNKAWRDASTELDRLRERYEEEDRTRGRHRTPHPRGRAADPRGPSGGPRGAARRAHRGRLRRVAREAIRAGAAPPGPARAA